MPNFSVITTTLADINNFQQVGTIVTIQSSELCPRKTFPAAWQDLFLVHPAGTLHLPKNAGKLGCCP